MSPGKSRGPVNRVTVNQGFTLIIKLSIIVQTIFLMDYVSHYQIFIPNWALPCSGNTPTHKQKLTVLFLQWDTVSFHFLKQFTGSIVESLVKNVVDQFDLQCTEGQTDLRHSWSSLQPPQENYFYKLQCKNRISKFDDSDPPVYFLWLINELSFYFFTTAYLQKLLT